MSVFERWFRLFLKAERIRLAKLSLSLRLLSHVSGFYPNIQQNPEDVHLLSMDTAAFVISKRTTGDINTIKAKS